MARTTRHRSTPHLIAVATSWLTNRPSTVAQDATVHSRSPQRVDKTCSLSRERARRHAGWGMAPASISTRSTSYPAAFTFLIAELIAASSESASR
jgi:hypothetical protein